MGRDCLREGGGTDCRRGDFPALPGPRRHLDLAIRSLASGARLPPMSARTQYPSDYHPPLEPAGTPGDIICGSPCERDICRNGWRPIVSIAFTDADGRGAASVEPFASTEAGRTRGRKAAR